MKHNRQQLILDHLYLARDIALREWRTAAHALNKDDMLGLANEGLVDAAARWETYCEKKGYDPDAVQYFKVFARLRIRGNIRDQLRKEDWTTRTVRTKSKKLKDAGQDEGLPVEELSARTGMTQTEIHKVNSRLALRPVSIDRSSSTEDRPGMSEYQFKEDEDTESVITTQEILKAFSEAISNLDYIIQIILVLRYYEGLSIEQIAQQLDMDALLVLELHNSAVLDIKKILVFTAEERV